jgi:alpha-amylase/alpha-mannosidase (GH57 family)
MIYWAPFFHLYQPPTQLSFVLKQVHQESYLPLVRMLLERPYAKATINIQGVLSELLWEHNLTDVLEGLHKLVERRQVELTGSGKYHPILPLLPRDEVRRQIELNAEANRRYLGVPPPPRGFFPPEMCYSRDIVRPILESGHRWLLMSGVGCPLEFPTAEVHYLTDGPRRLSVFFRDDIISNKISFKDLDGPGFVEWLFSRAIGRDHQPTYVITAMDGETFGHHIKGWVEAFLAYVYDRIHGQELGGRIRVATISELQGMFPVGCLIEPRASSWSSTSHDLARGVPFPLWKSPENSLHQWQWQHLELCLQQVSLAQRAAVHEASLPHARLSRELLDAALHSCQFWWASGGGRWEVNLVHRGLALQEAALMNATRAIAMGHDSESMKREASHRFLAAQGIRSKITEALSLGGPP